jgi:NADPH-dependent curcumin reductase CurA
MSERDTYLPAMPLGSVMRGTAIGIVERSRHPGFPEGTIVQGRLGWQEYALSNGQGIAALRILPGLPLDAWFGLFGHIGLTAYFGLIDVAQARAGETLVVSAAAGAVGSLTGQIGKILGCRVVGIAGSDEKCRWITEDLGFDAAINYRTETVSERLQVLCPGGIDVYFDNVGGRILEAVLYLINLRARIAVCGMISQYNATRSEPGPSNLTMLIMKRARMEGFLVLDYLHRAAEAVTALAAWYAEGRLKYRVDIVEGLAEAPRAINRLFEGSNTGKLIVRVSPEP